jgi:pimeloyl-ACP methyl ester carboxylesterase
MPAVGERRLRLPGGSLELVEIPAAAPDGHTFVLLHEGLGSVGLWRGFPRALAAATGGRTIAFSRYGHGRSDPPASARTPRFMHEEALDVLPSVLREVGAEEPVLVGHSDGASIALIYAAVHAPHAVVAMAPHVFVEELCLKEIRRAREAYVEQGLRERMAHHHRDPDAAFYGWNDVWLDPEFRAWDITDSVARIECPLLLIQGERDQYGTMAQLDAIERRARGPVARVHLGCQHAPHLEQPEQALEQIRGFVTALPRAASDR